MKLQIPLGVIAWVFVGGFVVASGWFGWGMRRLFHEPVPAGMMGWDGNTVAEPLEWLLGIGAPLALGGVVILKALFLSSSSDAGLP